MLSKKLKPILSVLVIFMISLSVSAHPLKLSVTEVRLDENFLKVKIKLFADDFEVSISSYAKNHLVVANSALDENLRNTISKYILQNFSITLNRKKVLLKVSDMKVEEGLADNNILWIELDCPLKNISKGSLMLVENFLLFDHIPEQKNIVYIIVPGGLEKKMLSFENTVPHRSQNVRL